MKEYLKNMSNGRKILLWNAIVMLAPYITYIIAYMISKDIGSSASAAASTAFVAFVASAAFAIAIAAAFAAFAAAFAAFAIAFAAFAAFAIAFAIAFAAFAIASAAAFAAFAAFAAEFVKEDTKISFWKIFPLYILQTALVFLIFCYAPFASFAMIGFYILTIAYLIAIEPKLIANLKANPPISMEEIQISNGAYRSAEIVNKKNISGFRLWLYKKLKC